MQSVEFNSYVKNGAIAIPEDFISVVPNEVYVIVKPIHEQSNSAKKTPVRRLYERNFYLYERRFQRAIGRVTPNLSFGLRKTT